ncbi:MAG: PEP-CTERM sorting domain-containing protein [Methylomonas sp.]|jgi:hypothetical protein
MKKLMLPIAIAASAACANVYAEQGLNGEYWQAPAYSTDYQIQPALNYIANHEQSAEGSFVATNINYTGGDETSIKSFLGSDGASFSGTNGNMEDGIIQLTGWIDISAPGSFDFTVNHDDGAQLTINGDTIVSAGCCGETEGSETFNQAGWYAITATYNNTEWNGGTGVATFSISENGSVISASDLSTSYPLISQDAISVSSVPEPNQYLLTGVGLAAIAWRLRKPGPVARHAYALA